MESSHSQQFADQLIEQISAQRWQVGDRLPSLRQLSKEFDVSVGIVRGAINLLYRRGYVRPEHGRGVFVCRPANKGQGGQKKEIALIVGTLEVEQIPHLIRGVQQVIGASDYHLSLHVADTDYWDQARLIEQVAASEVAGILFTPPTHHIYSKAMRRAHPHVPCLQASLYLDTLGIDAVAVDGQAMGRQAAQYLLDKGHRRIGILDNNSDNLTVRDMRLGIDLAMQQEDQRFGEMPKVVGRGDMLDTRRPWRLAQIAATKLLEEHPQLSAVIGIGTSAALGVVKAARAMNICVPDELSVIGTLCDMMAYEIVDPPVTVVAMPIEDIGARAARELLHRIETVGDHSEVDPVAGTQLIQLAPQLIERESVATLVTEQINQPEIADDAESTLMEQWLAKAEEGEAWKNR